MWPREHGAYVQLLAPLAAALITAPSLPGALIAVAAFGAFLANEALLVAVGGRGKRAKAQHGTRARRRVAVIGGTAFLLGTAGLARSPHAAWVVAAIAAIPAACAAWLATRRRIHQLRGELCATVALVGPCAVAVVAGGRSLAFGFAMWAAWSAAYALIVVLVQRILATHRLRRATRSTPLVVTLKRLGIAMTVASGIASVVSGLLA
jgi:hypothetical protein